MMKRKFQPFVFTCVVTLCLMGAPLWAQEDVSDTVSQVSSSLSKRSKVALDKKFSSIQAEIEKSSQGVGLDAPVSSNISTKKATGLFFKMIFGMIFIILLIVLSIRWLKSLQKSSLLGKKLKSKGRLEVLETCYLGKDQKVVLLNIGDKEVALGVTSNNIQLLKEMNGVVASTHTNPITVPINEDSSPSQLESFKENLNGFLKKYNRPKTVAQTLEEL